MPEIRKSGDQNICHHLKVNSQNRAEEEEEPEEELEDEPEEEPEEELENEIVTVPFYEPIII